jgi:CTD kinase subunit beta
LQYPPHALALGSLYVAALLSSFEQLPEPVTPGQRTSGELAKLLNKHGIWEEQFQSQAEDLEGIYHVTSFTLTND